MEKTVKSCGECPFIELHQGTYYCNWKSRFSQILGFRLNENEIHPNCPEGGEFVITTKKLDNESK